jgi:hypothetical protein
MKSKSPGLAARTRSKQDVSIQNKHSESGEEFTLGENMSQSIRLKIVEMKILREW